MPSGRYFGFVIGGGLPAALAADWLTSAWDQNAGLYVGGPAASVVEQIVQEWLTDLLGLPADASLGLVTGTQMGSVTALAAARFRMLERSGWDVARDGLAGGPRIRVLVGAEHGAWLHVDGAFGLWAAASPRLRHLVRGAERADSWITDAHKWLNVPYDSALVLCADPDAHRAAMTVSASYLIQDDTRAVRDQVDWVPEFSRRARGFAVYAALRSLGRSGLAELVERTCDCARRFAQGVGELEGVEVLNDVVLNQVLFRFETDERTDGVLHAVQEAGEVWMSGTTWDGRRAVRVSVSNWQTGDEEIDLALEAFKKASAPASNAVELLGREHQARGRTQPQRG